MRDAPTILLLHGVQSSRATWWRAGQDLADLGWRVLTVDLLGYGGRVGPRTSTVETLANDVLDQVHGHRVDLIDRGRCTRHHISGIADIERDVIADVGAEVRTDAGQRDVIQDLSRDFRLLFVDEFGREQTRALISHGRQSGPDPPAPPGRVRGR